MGQSVHYHSRNQVANWLKNRTTDLYDPKFCYPDNDSCSQQSYHNIGGFVPMEKQNHIQSVFKSQCKSINKRIYKLEVFLHLFKMNFTSFQKNYLEKQSFYIPNGKKDICDYDPRCILSSSLMFDDIIMDNIKIIVSSHNHTAEHDCVFTQIVSDLIYIYRG